MALFGSSGPGPAEKQARQQGAQMFQAGFPVMDMLSGLIRQALEGNVGVFENRPLGQRKASSARQAGAKRTEATRRNLAGMGLEKSAAGQAALQESESMTEGAVLDALLSEMSGYIEAAPQFGLQATGQGLQASSNAAAIEQRRQASDPWNALLPVLFQSLGVAAGTALGGPLGAAAGTFVSGLFNTAFASPGGGYQPTQADLTRSWMGPTPTKTSDVSIGGGFVS